MDGSQARRVLLAAAVLGVTVEVLFDGPALGLNVPLTIAFLLVAGWLVRRHGTAPDPLDVWLPVSAMVVGSLVAITGDRLLAGVDTVVALAFVGASMAAMSGVAVTRRAVGTVAAMAVWTFGATWVGAAAVIGRARPGGSLPRSLPAWSAALVRGLMLGIPIAAVFVVLFASADPIFGRAVRDALGLRLDLGDLPGRLVVVVSAAWFAAGLLSVAAEGIPPVSQASLGAAASRELAARSRLLGSTEGLVVLVLVDLVVGAFVGLQLAYLFGGLDTLAAAGMTYSDYTRRGFFELVAAACMAGALVVALEIAVGARSRWYLAAALALLALTGVVLASAWLRLDLYQQAYGWTELRFYVAAAIVTLAVALAVMAIALAAERMRWLGHALVVLGLIALVVLNALAPAAFVAERNVARVLDPSLVPADGRAGLDVGYLGALGDDAVPVLVAALPVLPEPYRSGVLEQVRERRAELGVPAFTSPAAWNLSRERARESLTDLP